MLVTVRTGFWQDAGRLCHAVMLQMLMEGGLGMRIRTSRSPMSPRQTFSLQMPCPSCAQAAKQRPQMAKVTWL